MSRILSGNPTDRQTQERKGRGPKPLPQWVTQRQNKTTPTGNQSHYTGTTQTTTRGENTRTMLTAVAGSIVDFLPADFVNVFEKPC